MKGKKRKNRIRNSSRNRHKRNRKRKTKTHKWCQSHLQKEKREVQWKGKEEDMH
jgi:hypothetical protein